MLDIKTSLAVFGSLAYATNTAAYIHRTQMIIKPSTVLLLGSLLVIAGYILMTVAKVEEIQITVEAKDEGGEGKSKAESEEEVSMTEKLGSGLLALFFTSSLFLGTNITLQLYDPVGAVGYSALFASAWFCSFKAVGPVFLVIYYLWGGLHKVGEGGFTNRAQLVGRIALAIYYLSYLIVE